MSKSSRRFMRQLTITDHSRESAGLIYVYPVISRRSGGLSIGINLNPNNACNWHCIYCQVPNLVRGAAPDIDEDQLRVELRELLSDILQGSFYDRFRIPDEKRTIKDVALAGNGEPTSCKTFDRIIELIGAICGEFGLLGKTKLVLITNGSLMRKPVVQEGLKRWSALGGEVWFKVDSATAEGMRRINQVHLRPETVRGNLEISARLCPTWIQTCLFAFDGKPPSEAERDAYLDFLAELKRRGVPIRGVLLYGLARPSMQPQAPRLSALPEAFLNESAQAIRAIDIDVRVSP